MKNIEYDKGIKADEQIGDYEDSLTAKYPNMFDDLPDEYDPKVFLNHIKSKIEPKEWKKLSGLYSKANQYSNKQYATYVNQLEDAIESNPVKAAEVLPEGSEIQKEAVEAAIGKGPEKEVNDKVVGDFLNTYKNPDVHLSETMEKENEEWRNNQLDSSIITNGTPASELSPHDLDMLDPTDKTEIAGDIDDMTAEDNGVLSDLSNQDENAEVEEETDKPIITDTELQSSATEAPETIDTFNGLTDNNAAELADTMSAIEELYKIHNSLPQTSGKVGSDAMLKEIAKHTKGNEEYKPGRYNDFLFNFKETPIPPSSAAPNIDAPEVTGNISGPPQNVIQNEPTITSTSNGLPFSSISTGTGNVSNGNVSTTSNNNDTSIITNGTPTSGSAPISKDANAPEARSFGGFLKGNKNNVPISKGISPDKNVSGSIKSGKGSLPSGGGHIGTPSAKASKVGSDKHLDTVGIIQKIYTASRSWPVEKGYHTKQCGAYKVSVKEQEILVSGNGFEHKNIKNVPPEVIKDIGNNL